MAHEAVWCEAGEDQCVRPVADGDDESDYDREHDYVDRDDDVDVDVDVDVDQLWTIPNEALPHLLNKKISMNCLNLYYL